VILELAEPRVRAGVWEHTDFRRDPVGRMRRTYYAAMVTVYAPRAAAEKMIAAIAARHARLAGVTPSGAPYRADDPELLDWVHATAAFGFLSAYHRYVRPLPQDARDRFYAEGAPVAALYGAAGAPRSEAEMHALLACMHGRLGASRIVLDFLDIVRRAPLFPAPVRITQRLAVRAAIALIPTPIRAMLGLGRRYDLPPGAETLLRGAGALADRVVLDNAPPAQACTRLGLASDFLYR
jgi:uncharacterized protein (DUF2236 family)